MVGVMRFVHRVFGGHAILVHQILQHVPVAAVIDRRLEDMAHVFVVNRQVLQSHDQVQEKVALFKLVPEEEVGRTQLKGRGQIVLLDHVHAQDVEKTEDPAAAAAFLVGNIGRDIQFVGKRIVHLVHSSGIHENLDGCVRKSVGGHGLARMSGRDSEPRGI